MENGDSDNASDDGDTDEVFQKISLEGFKKTKRKHCYGKHTKRARCWMTCSICEGYFLILKLFIKEA